MADILWTIERLADGGDWATVLSTPRLYDISATNEELHPQLDAAMEFTRCHLDLFAHLSGVGDPCDTLPAATPGLPRDASDYTRGFLDGDLRAIRDYNGDYEPNPLIGHGHIYWGLIEASLSDDPDDDWQHMPFMHRLHLSIIARAINKMTGLLGREILFGDVRYGQRPHHPCMADASNHERLEKSRHLPRLAPIAGHSMRLCVAYET